MRLYITRLQKMEAASASETLATSPISTWCNNLRTKSASIPDSITEVVNAVIGDEPIHFMPV
jgi:hypothetical protein